MRRIQPFSNIENLFILIWIRLFASHEDLKLKNYRKITLYKFNFLTACQSHYKTNKLRRSHFLTNKLLETNDFTLLFIQPGVKSPLEFENMTRKCFKFYERFSYIHVTRQ